MAVQLKIYIDHAKSYYGVTGTKAIADWNF